MINDLTRAGRIITQQRPTISKNIQQDLSVKPYRIEMLNNQPKILTCNVLAYFTRPAKNAQELLEKAKNHTGTKRFTKEEVSNILKFCAPEQLSFLKKLLKAKNKKKENIFNAKEISFLLSEVKNKKSFFHKASSFFSGVNLTKKEEENFIDFAIKVRKVAIALKSKRRKINDRKYNETTKFIKKIFSDLSDDEMKKIKLRRSLDAINETRIMRLSTWGEDVSEETRQKELKLIKQLEALLSKKNITPEVEAQSTKFLELKSIDADTPILDGFRLNAYNFPDQLLNGNSYQIQKPKFNYLGGQTIVDFKNDKILQQTIKETRKLLADRPSLSEKEKLQLIMRKTATTLSRPYGLDNENIEKLFGKTFDGMEIPLGAQIKMGKGVCKDMALLCKILADDADLKVGLHQGVSEEFGGHAWNTFYESNGKKYFLDVINTFDELLPFEDFREDFAQFK